jgi:glutaredoxin
MEFKKIEGEDRGEVRMYALSTCVWCRKTKRLLKKLGVAFSYVDVDQLSGRERDEAMRQMRIHNPRGSFPTLVIDGDEVIAGHDVEKIRKRLGKAGQTS